MIRFVISGLLAVSLCSAAQAGMLVSTDAAGRLSKQYFEDGDFLLVQEGRAMFGMDRAGNCWFIDAGQLVTDPCERMLDAMNAIQNQALAALGPQQRAMLQQITGMQNPARAPAISRAGSRTIAGYPAECHRVDDRDEVCVSAQLLREVTGEMGSRRFIEMAKRLGPSAGSWSGAGAGPGAVAALFDSGYPMRYVRSNPVSAIPGLDPAMLQVLPEAQRARTMQQLRDAGGGAASQAIQVVKVDRNVRMPAVDLSPFPRIGFHQFLQQNLGRFGAKYLIP